MHPTATGHSTWCTRWIAEGNGYRPRGLRTRPYDSDIGVDRSWRRSQPEGTSLIPRSRGTTACPTHRRARSDDRMSVLRPQAFPLPLRAPPGGTGGARLHGEVLFAHVRGHHDGHTSFSARKGNPFASAQPSGLPGQPLHEIRSAFVDPRRCGSIDSRRTRDTPARSTNSGTCTP